MNEHDFIMKYKGYFHEPTPMCSNSYQFKFPYQEILETNNFGLRIKETLANPKYHGITFRLSRFQFPSKHNQM